MIVDQLKDVGRNFRHLILVKGLTIPEIAGDAGHYTKTLYDLLNGKDCRVSTLLSVANALGVKIDAFFIGEEIDISTGVLPAPRKRRFELKNGILDMIRNGHLVEPLGSKQIAEFLNENYQMDTSSKSVSPVASRLAEDGYLEIKYNQSGHKIFFAL